MPRLLDQAVLEIRKQQGVSLRRAFAIATAGLQRAGDIKEGTQELTAKGRRRQAMSRAERERTR